MYGLRTTLIVAILAMAPGIVWAQAPGNRQLHRIPVVPDPTGSDHHIVTAYWSVDVESTPTPLDYSTEVRLLIGRTPAGSITEIVGIDGPTGGCSAGPPCGTNCGTGSVNGESVVLTCYKDNCDAAGCDCDCGVWISTEFPPTQIATGELIQVTLLPIPGTAPDNDDSDNGVDLPFFGTPLGWNRAVDGLELTDVGGGLYDVEVSGTVSWEGLAGVLVLDTTVDLVVNGTVVGSTNIPMEARQIFDQGCFESGCGNNCGSMNGIPRFCDPFLWWDCGCGGGWLTTFPGVPASAGDEITVLLRPAPGALPELPGFEGDDGFDAICCGTVGVADLPDVSSLGMRLDQNRPNPFNPRTTIDLHVARAGHVRIAVFDAGGRQVKTLLDRDLGVGSWSVTWDGTTNSGDPATSGTHFYRLETAGQVVTRRMTLLK